MFKVLFIYPGYENLGIEYLSASLKKRGFETRLALDPVLFDESGFIRDRPLAGIFSFRNRLLRDICEYGPDLICFSVLTDNYLWAVDLAAQVKNKTGKPVVFGGIHPTCVPQRVMRNDCVDFVCVGEGEDALAELCEALREKKRTAGIRNIWAKQDDEIVPQEPGPLREDLDSLPFADKELYYRSYPFFLRGYQVLTSRGCPYSCTYCGNNALRKIYLNKGVYLRRRSCANVIEELALAKDKYRSRFVHFADDVFTHDKIWLGEFLEQYKKRINLPYSCYISPSSVDSGTIRLLSGSGCFKAQMGIQSLDDDLRRRVLGRSYDNNRLAEIIFLCRQAGIYLTCDNIFGLPGEDEESLLKSAEFYSQNRPDNIEVFWLKYYPCTDMTAFAAQKGLIKDADLDKVLEGANPNGIARGGDTYTPLGARFQLLFNFFRFMPLFLRRFFLRKRLYRFFPVLGPACITFFFRVFNKAKFDIYADSTFRRYVYFMKRRLTSR